MPVARISASKSAAPKQQSSSSEQSSAATRVAATPETISCKKPAMKADYIGIISAAAEAVKIACGVTTVTPSACELYTAILKNQEGCKDAVVKFMEDSAATKTKTLTAITAFGNACGLCVEADEATAILKKASHSRSEHFAFLADLIHTALNSCEEDVTTYDLSYASGAITFDESFSLDKFLEFLAEATLIDCTDNEQLVSNLIKTIRGMLLKKDDIDISYMPSVSRKGTVYKTKLPHILDALDKVVGVKVLCNSGLKATGFFRTLSKHA